MPAVEEVLEMLKSKADPESVQGMKRFGMAEEGRLGLSMPEIRSMAKELGRDHQLAGDLWQSGIAEARILASLVAEPEKLTEAEMDSWVEDFNSWDVCDQVCMNLFEKSALAWVKIREWAGREEEFVCRASLALIACLAWHDKKAEDEAFIQILPVIERCAIDERNFVKKAASWALRNIGKRNWDLNQAVIQWVEDNLGDRDSRAARWIAADVLAELRGEAVQRRLKGKN